jgi:mycobactin lysine-N-oxygenase
MSEVWKNIAVVGAGPKGIALAAKASVINEINVVRRRSQRVRVTLFERAEIGAHWDGRHGYTDGRQCLCTSALRDLGFPYEPTFLGEEIQARMYQRFSWGAYRIDVDGTENFEDWVSRRSPPATHREFANYLRWAADKATAEVRRSEIVGLRAAANGWTLIQKSGRSERRVAGVYDAVVVTSPGPPRRVQNAPVDRRILDGQTFWSSIDRVPNLMSGSHPVVVIGGGGAAAAIIAWFARAGLNDTVINLVASQPTLFTRGDSYYEDKLFTDPETWQRLSPASRQMFSDRLNKGVVWKTIMNSIEDSPLDFFDARAVAIEKTGNRRTDPLSVVVQDWRGVRQRLEASLVVDASGFDPWWFVRLLRDLDTVSRPNDDLQRRRLMDGVDDHLCFSGGWELPPLSAPFLASKVGPGFGSLMCLGDMADRLLRRYA